MYTISYLKYIIIISLISSNFIFSIPICFSHLDCMKYRWDHSTFSKNLSKEFNEAVDQVFVEKQLVGVIVGIWVPELGTFIKTQGLGHVEKKIPISCLDQIRLGSITKTFTTTIILQLADEGLLDLDENIVRFNTGIPNADKITIRQLCNHTSGLYNYSNDPSLAKIIVNEPQKKWFPQELVQIAINHGPISFPGTEVKYNNTGFIIQGMIIEQLTGLSLDQAIYKRIIKPLRLRTTSLPTSSSFQKKFAHGYILSDTLADFSSLDPSASWAAGGIISNLKDLKKWAKALATGKLISSKMQKERLSFIAPPSTPGPFQGPFVKFGLGIENLGPFLGHEGDIGSYNCSINYLPGHDATFVVLTNKNSDQSFPSDNATALFMKLSKILFPEEVPW